MEGGVEGKGDRKGVLKVWVMGRGANGLDTGGGDAVCEDNRKGRAEEAVGIHYLINSTLSCTPLPTSHLHGLLYMGVGVV